MATQQLDAWTGKFGDAYIDRNNAQAANLKNQIISWSRILDCLPGAGPRSILEVGANIGHNLRALSHISDAELYGLEPNDRARTSWPAAVSSNLKTSLPPPPSISP